MIRTTPSGTFLHLLPGLRQVALRDGFLEDGVHVWEWKLLHVVIHNRESRAMIISYNGTVVVEVSDSGGITIKDGRWHRLGEYITTALGKNTP